MKAGSLKHRVTIQTPTDSQSSATGAVSRTWATLATVWTRIEPVGSKEGSSRALASQPEATHKVTMRYQQDKTITTHCRVIYGTRVLDIVGPPLNWDEANRMLILYCKEAIA